MLRDELSGQVLDDRYRVIAPIGEGAMGCVYRGERLKLGRVVAIKFLNEEIANDASRKRFEREAMAMAKLEHPHCATVFDVGVHGDRPYVVMEFVSGQNLKDLLKGGPLSIQRAVELTKQILSGLSHAHEHGLIHRDIKPANVVLSQKSGVGDQVKILDFGLARFSQDNSNLTGAMVLGTPNYMAPEQIRGGDIDHRVDLYACGVLLFELVTGVKPFQAHDPVAVCMQHINEPAPRLADKAPGRSFGAIEALVARALAKDPAARFQSADEFYRALAELGLTEGMRAPSPVVLSPATTMPLDPMPQLATQATVSFDPVPILAQTGAITVGGGPAQTGARPAQPGVNSGAGGQIGAIVGGAPSQTGAMVGGGPSQTGAMAGGGLAPIAATTDGARPRKSRRALALVAGGVLTVGLIVTVAVATRGDAKPAREEPGPAQKVVAPTPESPPEPTDTAPDAVADLVARSKQLAAAGRREAALDTMLDARKTYPQDARLPYEASKLYLDKMWWDDGLKQARAAIELDPAYKGDADLIKLVVKGFNTTKSYDWTLAKFLRETIGPSAKPFLEDTAENHPNPIVRKRAATELKKYR